MNNITIELCPEDRARIDKLTEALEARIAQAQYCIEQADTANVKPNQDIDEMLKKALATKPPKTAQDAPKAEDHPTLDPFPETPTTAEAPSVAPVEEAKPAVTMEMLRSKAITLAAAGKKDQVRAVVHPYAAKVTDVPADKWGEVYEKLTALEG